MKYVLKKKLSFYTLDHVLETHIRSRIVVLTEHKHVTKSKMVRENVRDKHTLNLTYRTVFRESC